MVIVFSLFAHHQLCGPFFLSCFFFFFFFQAEDGIRDHCVTGVQTCALPISSPAWCLFIRQRRRFSLIICADAVASWRAALLAMYSCPGPAIGWTWVRCTALFMFCHGKSGCAVHLRATDRASTTSVIASPCRPCCVRTAADKQLSRACPYCPRTSDTSMSAILTGTSVLAQS